MKIKKYAFRLPELFQSLLCRLSSLLSFLIIIYCIPRVVLCCQLWSGPNSTYQPRTLRSFTLSFNGNYAYFRLSSLPFHQPTTFISLHIKFDAAYYQFFCNTHLSSPALAWCKGCLQAIGYVYFSLKFRKSTSIPFIDRLLLFPALYGYFTLSTDIPYHSKKIPRPGFPIVTYKFCCHSNQSYFRCTQSTVRYNLSYVDCNSYGSSSALDCAFAISSV